MKGLGWTLPLYRWLGSNIHTLYSPSHRALCGDCCSSNGPLPLSGQFSLSVLTTLLCGGTQV